MANRCHDRRTGRFISAAGGRVQTLQALGERSDADWALDEAALAVLEAGIAKAIKDGWGPPAEWELEPAPEDDSPALLLRGVG